MSKTLTEFVWGSEKDTERKFSSTFWHTHCHPFHLDVRPEDAPTVCHQYRAKRNHLVCKFFGVAPRPRDRATHR